MIDSDTVKFIDQVKVEDTMQYSPQIKTHFILEL